MTLDEAIERELYRVEANRDMADSFHTDENIYSKEEEAFRNREDYHSQIAEWLRELKALKDFANFVAESVTEEEFEENSDFYAEVYCRKLHKMGLVEISDDKWILNNEEVEE